jgi:hypothetical protein
MLQEILDYIHNYFIKEVYRGTFKIESGSLAVDFLQNGQYYKIVGSVFNDGVHKYLDESDILTDEEFQGEIWAMAVPKAILDLETEIKAWMTEYGPVINNPYQSESFGGYSYSKASSTNASGRSTSPSWQSVFGSRLNAYRKIS